MKGLPHAPTREEPSRSGRCAGHQVAGPGSPPGSVSTCAPWSPAEPASSGRTSSTRSSRAGPRSWCSTTSAADGRRTSGSGADAREVGRPDARCGHANTFGASPPEVVFHLAAQIDVRALHGRPRRDAAINITRAVTSWRPRAAPASARVATPPPAARSTASTDVVPTPETEPAAPALALRPEQADRRGATRPATRRPGLDVVDAAVRQRVRAASGPAGDAGVIALSATALLRGDRAHGLRGRHPYPRLRLRRRHRRGQPRRRRRGRASARPLQRRHGHRGQRAGTGLAVARAAGLDPSGSPPIPAGAGRRGAAAAASTSRGPGPTSGLAHTDPADLRPAHHPRVGAHPARA